MEDFFISYNGADKAWAEWVAWELEKAGYTVIFQAWDFRPGTNFVAEMQRAADKSRRTIAILSHNYLRSKFAETEWTAAFVKDPGGEQGTLLPIRVEEFLPPGLLTAISYIDFAGKDEEEARRALLAGVQRARAKPTSAPPYPGKASGPKYPGRALGGGKGSLLDAPSRDKGRCRIPQSAPEPDRRSVLEQVRRVCIDGMLNDMRQELGAAFKIKISVGEDPYDAANARAEPATPDAVEKDIIRAFDDADHLLLILGEPGTGKTFKLLELLEGLLERAERGDEWRIPVYLNLSSWAEWAERKNPFRGWLVSEVMSFYGLSSKEMVEGWVDGEELILFLDGLDEITAMRTEADPAADERARQLSVSCRRKCLDEINKYIYSSNIWLALSCRQEEYIALGTKLHRRRDNSTAIVKPPTDAEVERYLKKAGSDLKPLREAVAKDPVLWKMAHAPFLLRTMSVAYRKKQGLSAKVIIEGGQGDEKARRRDLFEKYVQERRRVIEDPLPREYSLASIRGYLGELADKMERGNSKVFHVDQLQPSPAWLSPSGRWLYRLFVSLMLFLFICVFVGLPSGWALGYEWAAYGWTKTHGQGPEPIGETIRSFQVANMLLVTLCCGGIVAAGFALFKGLGFAAMCGLAVGVTRALIIKLGPDPEPESASINWATQGILSLVLGVAVLLLMMRTRKHDRDQISPLKRSKLHRRPALIGVATAASVGVVLGGILSLILGRQEGLPRGLGFGFALIPVCVLFYGYRNVVVEIKTQANQGIRNSATTALWTALWSSLTGAVCFGLSYRPYLGPQKGIVSAILGLSLGVTSLVYGGMPVMQHWSLRLVLYLRGLAPFRLGRFLKAAESLDLLRRVSGGYAFQHEYLREYFLEYHGAKKGRGLGGEVCARE